MLGLARTRTVSVEALAATRKSELLATQVALSASVSAEVEAQRKALAEAERLRQVQVDLQNIQKDVLRIRRKQAEAKATTALAWGRVRTEEENLLNLLNGGLDELQLEETPTVREETPTVKAELPVEKTPVVAASPNAQAPVVTKPEAPVEDTIETVIEAYMRGYYENNSNLLNQCLQLNITEASEEALMSNSSAPTKLETTSCGGSYVVITFDRKQYLAPSYQTLKSYGQIQPNKGVFKYIRKNSSTPELVALAEVHLVGEYWIVHNQGTIAVPQLSPKATAAVVDYSCPPPLD